MATFRKPQAGNPHRLTVNQHVFPAASIRRFSNTVGRVKVQLLPGRKIIEAAPHNALFCAMRAWDQRHEALVGKSVEDAFQVIADQVVNGRKHLDPDQHDTVTRFRSLWQLRAHYRDHPVVDVPADGLTATGLTQDQQEILESKHCAFVDHHGNYPGRMLAGLHIQVGLDRSAALHAGARWGILHATRGEFVFPDQFGDLGIVPISPTCILMIGAADGPVLFAGVRNHNRAARREAKRYLVARDFVACP